MSTYTKDLLKALKEGLLIHDIESERLNDSLMVFVRIEGMLRKLVICVSVNERYSDIICMLPTKKYSMNIRKVAQLAFDINAELLKNEKEYSNCTIKISQKEELFFCRQVTLNGDLRKDEIELYGAVMDIWNLSYYFIKSINKIEQINGGGCYIATAVYGSYDCPEVWTLRRYRDNTLAKTWYGRAFIKTYYTISPKLVRWFGHTNWFKKMWHANLDRMVAKLQANGVESTPYEDKEW